AKLSCLDRQSSFVGLPTSSFLCGFGWAIQANNFSQVNVSGNSLSGAWLVNPGVAGYWNGSTFYGSGWSLQPSGFGQVNYSVYSAASTAPAALQPALTSMKQSYRFSGSFQVTLSDPYAWWSGYPDVISW